MSEIRKSTAKFPGTCAACQRPIEEGDRIVWDPTTKLTVHAGCDDLDRQAGAVARKWAPGR